MKRIVPDKIIPTLFGISAITTLLCLASVQTARAQVGVGWTQIHPQLIWNGDLSQSERYSKTGDVEHFWVYNTDPHGPTGSGSRSEWHVNNSFSSGTEQAQGDFMPENGTDAYTVFQDFGNAGGNATALQLQVRSHNGTLRRYNVEAIATNCWGVYTRINVVHYVDANQIEVWANGSKVGTFSDGGPYTHWFKYGCYDTASATAYTGCYWRDMRFYEGGSAGSGYFQVNDRNSGKDAAVKYAATTNGAPVILYTFGSAQNDQWKLISTDNRYVQIVNRHSGKDLVVQGASTSAGAKIIQWTFGSAQNDQWEPVPLDGGFYKFVNRNSGLVLDVTGAYTTNNTPFEQWGDNGGNNQQFQLISTP